MLMLGLILIEYTVCDILVPMSSSIRDRWSGSFEGRDAMPSGRAGWVEVEGETCASRRFHLHWKNWYWALVPLLAIAAYAPALNIGFLSDDLILLYQAKQSGIDPHILVPAPHYYLYRPPGTMLIHLASD
jgi:hypothetical protein